MAYSNWGAKVFRNGIRMENRENVGVFDEEEANVNPSWMRIFVNISKLEEQGNDRWYRHAHHAVLGDGKVRLCAYKVYPELWVWREGSTEPEKINTDDNEDEVCERSGRVEVDGEVWTWYWFRYGNYLDLKLVEPDGTVWTATAGYQFY